MSHLVGLPGNPAGYTRLLDALGHPAAVGLTRKHDPNVVPRAHGHEMSPILLDARPVIHKHELERVPVEGRPLTAESPPGGLVEQLPIPAPVLGPSLLESPISRSNIGGEILPRKPPPSSGIPEGEEHDENDTNNYENDRKQRHGPGV
jgi:hypothetical protein